MRQSKLTPSFWTHKWHPISFSLCVDDFSVKYNGKQHADHLISVLKDHYTISQYWKGQHYLGIDLDWDHQNRVFHLSMLKYVANAIKNFHHKHPQKPQDQTYPHIKTIYGTKEHYSPDADKSPLLAPSDKKFAQ